MAHLLKLGQPATSQEEAAPTAIKAAIPASAHNCQLRTGSPGNRDAERIRTATILSRMLLQVRQAWGTGHDYQTDSDGLAVGAFDQIGVAEHGAGLRTPPNRSSSAGS